MTILRIYAGEHYSRSACEMGAVEHGRGAVALRAAIEARCNEYGYEIPLDWDAGSLNALADGDRTFGAVLLFREESKPGVHNIYARLCDEAEDGDDGCQ